MKVIDLDGVPEIDLADHHYPLLQLKRMSENVRPVAVHN